MRQKQPPPMKLLVALLILACPLCGADYKQLVEAVAKKADPANTTTKLLSQYKRLNTFSEERLNRSDVLTFPIISLPRLQTWLNPGERVIPLILEKDEVWNDVALYAQFQISSDRILKFGTRSVLLVAPNRSREDLLVDLAKRGDATIAANFLSQDTIKSAARRFPIVRMMRIECGDLAPYKSPERHVGFRVTAWLERKRPTEDKEMQQGLLLTYSAYSAADVFGGKINDSLKNAAEIKSPYISRSKIVKGGKWVEELEWKQYSPFDWSLRDSYAEALSGE
jgi:hypothetical protein